MGIVSRLFEPQASLSADDIRRALADAGMGGFIGGSNSASGHSVTPDTALRVSAVYACVQVIAQTVGQLPLELYRRTPSGKMKAVDHPLYQLVGSSPNKFNTSQTFREMLSAHTALRGNGCAFINRVGGGRVYELLPLDASSVGIQRDQSTWEVTYNVSQGNGISGVFKRDQIFHIMGLSLNGYSGVSPLTYARETIGLAMATEQYGSKVFKNGAKPSGLMSVPTVLKEDAYQRSKKAVNEGFSGEDAHNTMFLEGGATFTPISMTSDDAQFLETRQFQIPEIARFYRMPLHKIQDLTRSTNNNIEHQSLEFLTDTMLPWLTRWEQSLNTQLLTPAEQREYFFRFDLDDLMRADMKSRFEAYASGIASEILNPNECREKEDMNPYPGGEEYKNRNVKPAETPGKGGSNGPK